MTLTEALGIVNRHKKSPQPPHRALLACGFTPLHLQHFFAAELQLALPQYKSEVLTGLYGDLPGTLEQIPALAPDSVAIALEWPDLDARLGYRSLGGWTRQDLQDLATSAVAALDRLRRALQQLPAGVVVALSLPSLPLPPLFSVAGWQAAPGLLRLQAQLMDFAAWAALRPSVRVVNAQWLSENSAPGSGWDPAKELQAGFPYTLAQAAVIGRALAVLLAPPAPKKGLITDLDDTLWHGLVGEVGAAEVTWDLAGHGQLHGLYQKLLRSLAEHGVLLAVASKNEPTVVSEAFRRSDILLPERLIFPFEVHWQEKSGSVARILEAWNIAADAVVFVDDNPREVEEVRAVHPDVRGFVFPKNDPAAALRLLVELRDLFGREHFSEEDQLRLESLKSGAAARLAISESGGSTDTLLAQAEAQITFETLAAPADDPRILELVNKTNQFNLNGQRYTPAAWQQAISQPEAFLFAVSYQDKFGPLGKIAVLQGVRLETGLQLQSWVMSCRAFSRRIEHACLRMLFDRFAVPQITCAYVPTPRNSPLTEFLTALDSPDGRIDRATFDRLCPRLDQRIVGP